MGAASNRLRSAGPWFAWAFRACMAFIPHELDQVEDEVFSDMSSASTFSSSELSYLNDVLKDEAVGTKFTESETYNAWDTQLSEFILL